MFRQLLSNKNKILQYNRAAQCIREVPIPASKPGLGVDIVALSLPNSVVCQWLDQCWAELRKAERHKQGCLDAKKNIRIGLL
jgi:hypothetical protein